MDNRPYDLIITGRQAIDGDTAQVGPQISEHLGIPNISYTWEMAVEGQEIEVKGKKVKVGKGEIITKRQFDDGYQMIKVKLPCLCTALAELNTPRYMSPGGIFDAYREKEVKILGYADLKPMRLDEENIGLKGSPTNVVQSFPKQVKGAGTVKTLDPKESAQWLVECLQEKHIL
jgi:electron transfer flavoprotein beta subunit